MGGEESSAAAISTGIVSSSLIRPVRLSTFGVVDGVKGEVVASGTKRDTVDKRGCGEEMGEDRIDRWVIMKM